jgi:hypothetical protein
MQSSGAVYLVTSRGNAEAAIFFDDIDRNTFPTICQEKGSKGGRSAFDFYFLSSAVTICNYTGMGSNLPLTNLAS